MNNSDKIWLILKRKKIPLKIRNLISFKYNLKTSILNLHFAMVLISCVFNICLLKIYE